MQTKRTIRRPEVLKKTGLSATTIYNLERCGDEWTHFDLMLGLTEDLLPVVSNPKATISLRSNMKEVGKTPSLYNGERQAVGIAEWTRRVTTGEDITRWSKDRDLGICIQTRHVRALDIDIPDADESSAVRAFISERYALPVRSRGNAAKFLVAFDLPGEFTKRRFKTAKGVIEFLANGQQFIAVGRHPSGARYEWEGGLPDVFPVLSAAEFEALWQGLADAFAVEAPVERSASVKQAKLDAVHENDPIAKHLHDAGMVKRVERDGRLHIACPWEAEHTTDSGDSSSTYWPAHTGGFEHGGFQCLHAHCEHRTVVDLKEALGMAEDASDDFGVLVKEDYDALKALKVVADAHRVAVVVVHHTRKGAAEDPLAMVSGTQGLAGSADGLLLLERPRGATRGSLHVIGRDVEGEGEFVVEFNDCRWSMVGAAKAVASTLERQEVLDALNDAAGPLTAAELADAVGKKRTTVARLLSKMVNEGTVTHNGTRYSPALSALAVES